jgi:hypothetical protein
MVRGLDAATILTPFAKDIADAGFAAAGRYFKSLTRTEVDALHAHGIGVWLIFETTATRSLNGGMAGTIDGAKAAAQARTLAAPPGTGIYATVDTDVSDPQRVAPYFAAFAAQVRAVGYRMGAYADGAILKGDAGLIDLPWIPGAMGWSGSADFLARGDWVMRQGPQINAGRTAQWAGVTWPAMGFAYDPNLARAEFGVWPAVPPVVVPVHPVLRRGSEGPAVEELQRRLKALGYAVGRIDGDYGPRTEAAVLAFQAARRITVDGVVGNSARSTWNEIALAEAERSASS